MKASPLRGGYLVRNPVWNAWLRLSDAAWKARLSLFRERAEPFRGLATDGSDRPFDGRRILVAVSGHLGDAVIATSLLSQVERAIPGAEIGILTGSWNRPVFDGHPRVRWIHLFDHWKLNRIQKSLPAKWIITRRMLLRVIEEIAARHYDAAIDLAQYYPNSSRVLWEARIPKRIGYATGGGGPLYTHAVPWSPRAHVAADHFVLLEKLAPGFSAEGPLRYELPVVSRPPGPAVDRLSGAGISPGDYVVIHAGAGMARKEWPVEKWSMVARALIQAGTRVVLTGAGYRQRVLSAEIAERAPGSVNLCDELEWSEFRAVLAGARVVLSVDTVAMHLAAGDGVPCVALMSGMDDPTRWRPLGENVALLTQPVPCAPCYRSRGCADMTCIREIAPDEVMAAAQSIMEL